MLGVVGERGRLRAVWPHHSSGALPIVTKNGRLSERSDR